MRQRLDRVLHGFEHRRLGDHFPVLAVVAQVVGAGFEHGVQQLLLVDAGLLDDHVALLREHPRDRVLRAEVAVVLAQHVADLADGAVLVVGHRLDDDRRAAGAVALVVDLFVGDARQLAGAALDRPLDVLGRHVGRLGFGDHGAQPRVHVEVAAAIPGRDGHFLDEAREQLAALGVKRALLVLDGVPLGMAGHGVAPKRENGKSTLKSNKPSGP